MNRIERISAILIQLQSKKIVRGQDLADRFSISLRTVYRDIKVLEESGVPIVGEVGTGYSLMDGYRLPPVMFTKEEAVAFLTAEKLVSKLTDPSTYKVYQSAMFKIKAVLTSDDKAHVEKMGDYIEVIKSPYFPERTKTDDHIQTILNCVSQKKILAMDYFANHNKQSTSRNVEPIGIFLMANQWYLIAFCWLRNDYRTFRIDRIKKSLLIDQDFKKQHPSLKNYLREIVKEKKELVTIVIRIKNTALKYIGEQKFYNGFVSEKTVNDYTEMTFLTASLEGFARWYMMLGDHAEIVTPAALKLRVKDISKKILKTVK